MEYYDVLGVEKGAPADQIKKAYKEKAMKHHPDKNNGDPKSAEIFKKLTEAYTVLSDEDKRAHYDRFGTMDDVGGPGSAPDMSDMFRNMFGGGGDFGQMFGQMFGGGGRPQQQANIIHCEVTLEEVFTGTTKKIDYEITNTCHACKGCGALDPKDIIKCMTCHGSGNITQRLGPMFMTQSTCPACFGNGTSIKSNKSCGHCHGLKEASYKKSFKMEVPKGIPDNFQHKLDGKGHFNKGTNNFNDLVVVFHYGCPPNTVVDDRSNIRINMDLKLDDLLCGFVRKISPYGQDLVVTSTGYFNPTSPMVFTNKGLPVFQQKGKLGDLVISFKIVYGDDEKAALKKYQDVFLKIYKKEAVEVDPASATHILLIN